MTDSRPKARRLAGELERDAAKYPDERTEILLEAATQWSLAGEPERALRIYDDVIAMDVGWTPSSPPPNGSPCSPKSATPTRPTRRSPGSAARTSTRGRPN
ncbi:hypothetical protein [Actinomadura chokoriensis]|uniref:hypothetical protein n=1 Tax=Actinomadura chokoriensis TaxID=454156 RepID=UPI0031F765E3